MTATHSLVRRFAARGVVWRHYLDFGVSNIPFYLQPSLLFCCTVFFFVLASSQRRALLANLRFIFPRSWRLTNYLRAFWSLWNFSWTIAEAATYKLSKKEFTYEIEGAEFLDRLGRGKGALVLTAHMGNYDLGAALFAQKFNRELRMVRAPEPDERTARHLSESVQRSGEGAVKIDYNTGEALLSFDLLGALRRSEIVSIQGDRTIPGAVAAPARLFGQRITVPSGPFTLAFIAEVPIYPLFIIRAGYRRYRIVVRPPILLERTSGSRNEAVSTGVATWCGILEETIAQHWDQWFALVPFFNHVEH